ncbi:hypothetical protein HGG82_07510 [Marinomonas sp. M1K-6]|uniref:Uncharacterized protein n=1 Tax=Marinomonas profundi TaxID=2726122 RepID=A0A847R4Q1_9GAMM|nr:hypothetical protein [Marinomonas profundi]NLQ17473.1 hypothetical protein [Marinomonas profundi]UDV01995.1 hypothetical protein J8N69_10290 [Marinomonas profundi]
MKNEMKYDTFGNLDTDYYVEKAYELRRAYFTALIKKMTANVKAFFANVTASRPLKSASQH